MSTIGSLLALADPNIKPWYEGQQGVNREQIGRQQAQTGLIELQRLKESQAAEQEFLLAMKNNPELAQQLLGGGSVLGSLGTAPAPAPGAITQGTLGPGGVGGTQTIPAPPNLSQFATQGAPQSTLASLGPAGQPQPQPPQNPLLAMARQNPRAALLMRDQQIKAFTTQLTMREKTAEAFASKLQGVNSQESYEVAVQDLMQWAPEQAARLPRVWSKEAMQPIIASALSAKDRATLQIAELNEQTDLRKQQFAERQAAAGVPKYTEDSTLNVAIDRRMQQASIPRGTPPPEAILTQAQEDVETGKIRVSASQGTGQIVKGPTGEYIRVKPGTDQVEVIKGPGGEPLREKPSETEQKGATLANSVAAANKLATALEDKGYKPSVWDKGMDKLPLGLGNYVTSSDYQQYRQTVREFASAWLYGVSGAQITDSEWENANQTFFPQPNEDKAAVALKRERRAALVKQLEQQTAATGRTGTQAPPTSQSSTGAPKPVSQMTADETRAEIAAIKARGGR
jgi:hypothetical protein